MKSENIKSQYINFVGTEKGAAAYSAFKKVVYGERDALLLELEELLPNVLDVLEPTAKYKCLIDIGAGDGVRTKVLQRVLSRQLSDSFTTTLVEPSFCLLNSSEKVFSKDGHNQPIKLNEKFESVCDELPNTSIYTYIHSIFCIDIELLVEKISKVQSEGGISIVVADRTNSVVRECKAVVDENCYSQSSGKRFTLDDLLQKLQHRNLSFHEFPVEIEFLERKSDHQKMISTFINWLSLGRKTKDDLRSKLSYITEDKFLSKSPFLSEKESVVVIAPNETMK